MVGFSELDALAINPITIKTLKMQKTNNASNAAKKDLKKLLIYFISMLNEFKDICSLLMFQIMNIAYLLIGGNLGNRSANLKKAILLIDQTCGKIVQTSAIYETAAWGLTNQPAFYNQAVKLQTNLPPELLMEKLLAIETKMGRVRKKKLGPRIIDLDMLFYNQIILESDSLTIPHPAIAQRRFALLPIAEIAANLIHPVYLKSMEDLLMECPDQLDVQKLSI
jgi:2-amino-4-hydroxy-6-hydroxymethyldihydropteridine diphosphokinase